MCLRDYKNLLPHMSVVIDPITLINSVVVIQSEPDTLETLTFFHMWRRVLTFKILMNLIEVRKSIKDPVF